MTVKVTDDGQGHLSAAVSGLPEAGATFKNTYSASGQLQLSGRKTLSGGRLLANQFHFQLLDADGKVLQTVSNTANGTFSFEPIAYTRADAGEHTYTVCEVVPADADKDPNVTYDARIYTVKVNVTDDGKGHMVVTEAADSADPDALNFTNQQAKSGTVALQVSKTINGQLPDAWYTGRFQFVLTGEAGAPMPTNVVATNVKNGIASFGTITYTSVGAYNYTIREAAPMGEDRLGGMTYDGNVVRVRVTVVNNNGQLVATPTYTYGPETGVTANAGENTFKNHYEAKGSITLTGTKAMNGRKLTQGDTFAFTVKDADGNVVSTGTSDAMGNIRFAPIKYTQDDAGKTFTYYITEDAGNLGGVTYDSSTKTVEVAVTDNHDGTLNAYVVSAESDKIAFTNTYHANATGFEVSGTKELKDKALAADAYEFQLTTPDGTEVGSAKNDAKGNFTITTAKDLITEAGTYGYQLREVNGGATIDGVTYDKHVANVTVEVSDNGKGQLVVDSVTTDAGATTFTNTYDASGSITLAGTKELIGRKMTDGDNFTFTVKEGDNVVSTGASDKDGKITFSPISYTLKDLGTHTYTVTEDAGEAGGVTYDKTAKTVTVQVTDNGDGTLSANVLSDRSDKLAFTNTYAAKSSFTPEGTKTLTGREITDSDSFTFTAREGEKTVSTGKAGTDGKIAFDAIDYTLDDLGEHTYVITEDAGEAGGVTYDKTAKTVVVNVTDNGDGSLKAEVVSEKSEPVAFTNTYAAEGSIALTGSKTLTGRDMADGEFSFSVKDADGKVVSTGKADAKGTIAFAPISYTLADAGEHAYTVTEDAGKLGGVTYDTATKTVVVNVTDNGDGTLKAEVVAEKSDDIAFTNKYQATKTSATLKVTKSYNAWKDGVSFGFTLAAKDGAPMPEAGGNKASATKDAKTATFGAITFTKAGTYHYVITEDLPEGVDALHLTKDGITYDVAEHPVTVTVTDNGKGKLVVSKIDYDGKSSLKVKNTYTTEHHGGNGGGSSHGGSGSSGSGGSGGGTAQTGDATSYAGAAGLAAAGAALVAVAVRRRKREQE